MLNPKTLPVVLCLAYGCVAWLPCAAIAQDKPAEPTTKEPSKAPPDDLSPAIGGYCPVSYFTDSKAIKGDPNYKSEHDGFVFLFASAEKKATFDKEPDKYAPRLGGMCAVALGGPYGNRFHGDPTVFAIVNGKLYLISSQRAKMSFDQRPEHYTDRAEALQGAAIIGGYCPVKYQTDNVAAPGDSQYLRSYGGFAYLLSSADAVEKFKKDPQRYVPAFNGYCALAVSQEKEHPGNPKVFAVVDGRTYLFFDEASKDQCLSRSPSCIAEAQENWPQMVKKIYRAPGK
jgi:YHS domain-containing protein